MTPQLTFLGATGTVTGSKYLLSTGSKKILIDCGLFQGLKQLRLKNWEALPLTPRHIDAVVLTHAHIDHSGYLPVLVKNGYTGRVYCTPATRDLCRILLPDAGHLQEEEARHANQHGFSKHRTARALFTEKDALRALKRLQPVAFEDAQKMLGAHVKRALSRGGVVVIPAFAVGRAQTLLNYLAQLKRRKAIPEVPVFLNSPMAINATRIYHNHRAEHRLTPDECKAACDVATMVNTADESRALNQRSGPMIIISASGMATGGRVLHHLTAFASDPRNMVLFPGFQAAGTRGASMLGGADAVKIWCWQKPVTATVTCAYPYRKWNAGLRTHRC